MTTSNTNDPLGFGKFVPGFDFLQGLSKGAAQANSASSPASAAFNQWFTPTMSAEDLDKRIGELKTVQFWLEQNTRALAATIQALEVQKMTLATLKSMNFPMPGAFAASGAGAGQAAAPEAVSEAAPEATPASPAVDPMQMWNALTQQFQSIAATALKDVGTAASQAAAKPAPAAKKAASKGGAARAAARPAAKKTASSRARKRS